MEPRLSPTRTVPVDRPRPWPMRLAVVLTAAIVLSVLRPWGSGARTPPGSSDPAGAPSGLPDSRAAANGPGVASPSTTGILASESAAPTRSPAPDEIPCPQSGSQLVSLDRLGEWTVRTWSPFVPRRATGPLDPALEPILMDSPAVLGIGICVSSGLAIAMHPVAGAVPAGGRAAVAAAWSIEGRHATPVPLEALGTLTDRPDLAILYRPAGAGREIAAWPPGRYALQLRAPVGPASPAGTDDAAWYLVVTIPPPR